MISNALLTGDIVSVKNLADQNMYSYKQKNKRKKEHCSFKVLAK